MCNKDLWVGFADCVLVLSQVWVENLRDKGGRASYEVEERGRVPGPAAKEEKEIVGEGEGEGHYEQEKGLCMMC